MSEASCEGAFNCMRVTGQSELRKVFEIRYKAYCEEWGFERPEDHPGQLEHDEFDNDSVHFICAKKDSSDDAVATIRLILNSEKGFPIERHCKMDEDLSHLDRNKLAEISRLAISKQYMRRKEDHIIYDGRIEQALLVTSMPNERRKRQQIVCGLYKCIYKESKKRGLTHLYAVMAKGLHLLLTRFNMTFVPIGPEVDYHGPRRPYLGCIADIEREVSMQNPELYAYFINDLD